MSDIKKAEQDIGRHENTSGEYSMADLIEAAQHQSDEETRMNLKQLLKMYYPAALWSMGLSLGGCKTYRVDWKLTTQPW